MSSSGTCTNPAAFSSKIKLDQSVLARPLQIKTPVEATSFERAEETQENSFVHAGLDTALSLLATAAIPSQANQDQLTLVGAQALSSTVTAKIGLSEETQPVETALASSQTVFSLKTEASTTSSSVSQLDHSDRARPYAPALTLKTTPTSSQTFGKESSTHAELPAKQTMPQASKPSLPSKNMEQIISGNSNSNFNQNLVSELAVPTRNSRVPSQTKSSNQKPIRINKPLSTLLPSTSENATQISNNSHKAATLDGKANSRKIQVPKSKSKVAQSAKSSPLTKTFKGAIKVSLRQSNPNIIINSSIKRENSSANLKRTDQSTTNGLRSNSTQIPKGHQFYRPFTIIQTFQLASITRTVMSEAFGSNLSTVPFNFDMEYSAIGLNFQTSLAEDFSSYSKLNRRICSILCTSQSTGLIQGISLLQYLNTHTPNNTSSSQFVELEPVFDIHQNRRINMSAESRQTIYTRSFSRDGGYDGDESDSKSETDWPTILNFKNTISANDSSFSESETQQHPRPHAITTPENITF